jgi:hypothetical protein
MRDDPDPFDEYAIKGAELRAFGAAEAAQELADLPLPVELFDDIRPTLLNRHLVKGLLLAGTMTTVFGQEGSAKSFLVLDIFLHVAAGLHWFGRKVRQGGVVYIVAEGAAGARGRVEAWKRDNGIAKGLPFVLIPTSVNLLDPQADLANLHVVIRFLTSLWGAPPVAIGIDTLAQTIGGGDENTSDMAAYIANCIALTAPYECAAVIVHHQPLDASSKRPRGHSSLAGAMDTLLHVEGQENPRRVTVIKQKDLERGSGFMFNLKQVEIGLDEEGVPACSCVIEQVEGETLPKVGGRRLSPTNKTALDALDRVTVRQGFLPPAMIPSGVIGRLTGKVTNLSGWLEEAVAAFADPDKSPDTPRRVFSRARKELQAAGIVGVHGDYVWRNHT